MGCGDEAGRRVTSAGVVGGCVCGCDGGVGGFEFLVVWEDGEGVGEEVWGWRNGEGGEGEG